MNLSDLLKKDLVEEFESDKEQIRNEISSADKNIASSKKMLGIEEWGWAHAAAYTAMLNAGRALMFFKGYRPKGRDHHVAVISFIQAVFSAKFTADVLKSFDNGRKRRHEFTYDNAELISSTQAKNLVESAETFVNKAKEILKIS